LILLPAILVGALTVFVVNGITPVYRSEAKISLEGRDNVFLRPEAEKSVDRAAADQEAIATQVQVLQSRDIARQVIRELKLTERPEFNPPLTGGSRLGAVLSAFGIGRDQLKTSPEERAMEAYFARLSVTAVDRSRVITVTFQSEDPDLAAKIANAILDAYLRETQIAKQEQIKNASAYLATEIEQLRKTVQAAESKVEDFRAKSNLFMGSNSTSLGTQQLGELTTQLAAARAQKADLDAKSRLIRDMLKSGSEVESADIVNSDLLKRLVEQRVLLRAQLAEQSSTLLERHPRIQELNAQINALDTQMRGELRRLVLSLENDARIANARIEATSESVERLKKQISGTSPQDVQLRALEREAKAQRDLLEAYLARYREATSRENLDSTPADARIISRATVSNVPSYPKKLPIIMIATLATAFLAAAFVLASEILKQNPSKSTAQAFRDPEDNISVAPRRSIFSVLKRKKPVASATNEPELQSDKAVALRPIADLVKAVSERGEAGRRVTVIGAGRNVGTTYTAISLARALAAEGKHVVLADLALHAPNLSILSTDANAPGFAELVRGTASFGDIITRDKFSKVHLIATGNVAGEAPTILTSPRLIVTLEALARNYDHVIVDGGALAEAVPEFFARMAPCAVLVATDIDNAATTNARDQLVAAGFADVLLWLGTPGPDASSQPVAA
jgi:uncharacterized protein involved in exopolysaccharide biosynthesis